MVALLRCGRQERGNARLTASRKEADKADEEVRYVITEFEPTFDAADFVRLGRDIIGQKSHVTNEFGIQWLQQHLGEDYQIHIVEVSDTHPDPERSDGVVETCAGRTEGRPGSR